MTAGRNILFTLLFYATTIPLAAAACCLSWGPSIWVVNIARIWSSAMLFEMKWALGITCRTEGMENLPRKGRYIVASKHQSAWETIVFQHFFWPAAFMFKKELLYMPLFGLTMLKAGCIPVDRGATTRKGLAKIVGKFKDRLLTRNMLVFPEGTRTPFGAAPKYKSGIAIIAAAIGEATIVPVALNSGRVWPKRGPRRPGEITLRILPPFSTRGMTRLEIEREIEARIEDGMRGL